MCRIFKYLLLLVVLEGAGLGAQTNFQGVVKDGEGAAVQGAHVTATYLQKKVETNTDAQGRFQLVIPADKVSIRIDGSFIVPIEKTIAASRTPVEFTIQYAIAPVRQTLVITSTAADPAIDRRNDAIYKNTLFNRDDQIFDTLASGINAGQHEGGGKSIEVRRFGFNLDHGGVSGGLKVLVDNVQQNEGTQGHGQGYLGQLKSLTPELVDDVDILNGPFSAEYGDFSGLGVVHIRLKERLQDRLTVRLQGGSFGSYRTFLAYSPRWKAIDSFISYEGSRTNGPFVSPLNYRRDNLTTNFTRHLSPTETIGFRFNAARNDFNSSGQIPLDQVAAGNLDRFGYVDPYDGGNNRNATAALYFKKDLSNGDTLRIDGFASRNLFDLWSNFTFYLVDPVNGDEFLQHDSRLQEGTNVQWLHPWKLFGHLSLLTVGSNLQDNQINVGLFHTVDRQVIHTDTSADAHVTNAGWYAQQAFDFRRVHVDLGLRYDVFRFAVADRLGGDLQGTQSSGQFQPKAGITWTPRRSLPFTLHANYGRGISSQDARGVVLYPNGPKVATTDFFQLGASTQVARFSMSSDFFLIDRSNEQVYVPDDGSIEFRGPSRSYGWETKFSVQLLRHLSWNSGVTQVSNGFYRGTFPRQYVDSAPHTVVNSGLTLADWKGFFSSLRYRHIGGYILDPVDRTARATGLDVVDLAVTKKLRKGFEANVAIDNVTNHRYYETQNWFQSRLTPTASPEFRVHGTPDYGVGVTAGLTFRWE